MATFDACSMLRQAFGTTEDKAIDFKALDGSVHRWTFVGGGAFLNSEWQRYLIELSEWASDAKKVEGDESAQMALITGLREAQKRFARAWKAQVKSEDGSASEWIDAYIGNIQWSVAVINGLLTELGLNEPASKEAKSA